MNHYPHHIGDYIKSTVHLNNEQDLTYRRLLAVYYDTEKPIPKDAAAVAKRIRVKQRFVVEILTEFFIEKEDGWHNKRCDEEIAKYQAFVQFGKDGAAKRWGKPADSPPIGRLPKAISNQNQNHKPEPSKEQSRFALPDWVPLEAWQGFCEMRSKSKSAFTERAKALLVAELFKLVEAGGNAAAILNQSTANGWKGVFPLKSNGSGGNGSGPPWWASNEGIEAKAKELGITARNGETWNDLKARVQQRLGA